MQALPDCAPVPTQPSCVFAPDVPATVNYLPFPQLTLPSLSLAFVHVIQVPRWMLLLWLANPSVAPSLCAQGLVYIISNTAFRLGVVTCSVIEPLVGFELCQSRARTGSFHPCTWRRAWC